MKSAGRAPENFVYNAWDGSKKEAHQKRGRRPTPINTETQKAISELQACMNLDDFIQACERSERRLDRKLRMEY